MYILYISILVLRSHYVTLKHIQYIGVDFLKPLQA